MKINCDVIRDLLPLYAEDLSSDSSRKLVDEHLTHCEGCRRELELLKKPAHIPQEEPGIDTVRREIGRRRALAVCCSLLLLCAILCWTGNWLTAPIYLDESIITSIEEDDGSTIWITLDAAAVGEETFQYEVEPTLAGETITTWTSHWLRMKWNEPEPRRITIPGDVVHNGIYYFTGRDGEEDLLIYENPQKYINGGIMSLPRLFLSTYFMLALGLGALLLAAAWFFRREKFAKYLMGTGSLALCYALCQGIICGFTFASFFAHQEFAWAVVMTVCLWGAGLCAYKLKR